MPTRPRRLRCVLAVLTLCLLASIARADPRRPPRRNLRRRRPHHHPRPLPPAATAAPSPPPTRPPTPSPRRSRPATLQRPLRRRGRDLHLHRHLRRPRHPRAPHDPADLPPHPTTRRRAAAPPPPPTADATPPPNPRDVEAAIARAKAYLYAVGQNGTWDVPSASPSPGKDLRTFDEIQNSTQWGGLTALGHVHPPGRRRLPPGASPRRAHRLPQDRRDRRHLRPRLPPARLEALPPSARKDARELARRDRDLLLKNKRTDGPAKGLFRYLGDDVGADHSASQFAVLGLWAADQLGAEVPLAFWRETETAWLADQRKDGADKGGWAYAGPLLRPTDVTPSMTAAGVATLFITADAPAGGGGDCGLPRQPWQ